MRAVELEKSILYPFGIIIQIIQNLLIRKRFIAFKKSSDYLTSSKILVKNRGVFFKTQRTRVTKTDSHKNPPCYLLKYP